MSNESMIMKIRKRIQISKKIKKPTLGKIILQCAITIVSILCIWGLASYTIEVVTEENSTEEFKWLLGDLNDGDYAECVEFYSMKKYLGTATDEKYEQFEEFKQFYMQYILCVEYEKAEHPEQYRDQLQESLDRMQQICQDSSYPQNIPHYEYLIESVVDAKDL